MSNTAKHPARHPMSCPLPLASLQWKRQQTFTRDYVLCDYYT